MMNKNRSEGLADRSEVYFKKTENEIKKMPKVELHRHLEGCVRTQTIIEIAGKHNLKLPTFNREELEKIIKLRSPMNSLKEVLRMFEIAQSMFVSYDAIGQITWQALEDAYKKENIKLLELRYSPDFMLSAKGGSPPIRLGGRGAVLPARRPCGGCGGKNKALDWNKVLEIISSTIKEFEKKHSIFCGIIIIASRSYGMDSVLKTIDFAVQHKNSIVGFDFADNEKDYPSRIYENAVKNLHSAGIPITVHSGEEGHFSQVIETIQYLGPRRIGHGVKAVEDKSGKTIEMIKNAGITVETNPWSNYLTHAVESIETHPLKKFIESGLKVSISADDPEILDTNLNKEYFLAIEKIGLSLRDIQYTLKCALESSFLEPDKKQQTAKYI